MIIEISLDTSEITTAANALRLAADQYERDAETVGKVCEVRLMQQFQKQALEARDLADKLEELQ